MEPDEGSFKWGVTTSLSYFPKDNSEFFEGVNMNLVDWLRQYAPEDEQTETFLRGFLGRMLFSGEEVKKKLVCFQVEKSTLYADVIKCECTFT